MNYNYVTDNRATRRNYIVFDIETAGREGVDEFLPEPEAPGNLKDPVKIADAIERKREEQRNMLALDMNLNRIVALGMYEPTYEEVKTFVVTNDDEERLALSYLWEAFCSHENAPKKPLIGFNNKAFDIPVCLRRTQLLGMPLPKINLNRYNNYDIIDLYTTLTFDAYRPTGVMRCRLKNFCKLFDIPVDEDDCDGSEVSEMLAAGKYDEIRKHVAADVERTRLLAEKIGVI